MHANFMVTVVFMFVSLFRCQCLFRNCDVSPPPVDPPMLQLSDVPVYFRHVERVFPYNTPNFHSAPLECKLLLSSRCEHNAKRAFQLILRDRRRVQHFKDFKEWVHRHNRMQKLISIHKSAREALASHMYDNPASTNGHIE